MSQITPTPRTAKQVALVSKVTKLYQGGTPVTTISKKFDISRTTVYHWIRTFAEETTESEGKDMDEPNKPRENDKPLKGVSEQELEAMSAEEQIAVLKEALRMSELRADLYDEIINVAEAKYKISLRKKAGAKQ